VVGWGFGLVSGDGDTTGGEREGDY